MLFRDYSRRRLRFLGAGRCLWAKRAIRLKSIGASRHVLQLTWPLVWPIVAHKGTWHAFLHIQQVSAVSTSSITVEQTLHVGGIYRFFPFWRGFPATFNNVFASMHTWHFTDAPYPSPSRLPQKGWQSFPQLTQRCDCATPPQTTHFVSPSSDLPTSLLTTVVLWFNKSSWLLGFFTTDSASGLPGACFFLCNTDSLTNSQHG